MAVAFSCSFSSTHSLLFYCMIILMASLSGFASIIPAINNREYHMSVITIHTYAHSYPLPVYKSGQSSTQIPCNTIDFFIIVPLFLLFHHQIYNFVDNRCILSTFCTELSTLSRTLSTELSITPHDFNNNLITFSIVPVFCL